MPFWKGPGMLFISAWCGALRNVVHFCDVLRVRGHAHAHVEAFDVLSIMQLTKYIIFSTFSSDGSHTTPIWKLMLPVG
jgi:hypothetical protein